MLITSIIFFSTMFAKVSIFRGIDSWSCVVQVKTHTEKVGWKSFVAPLAIGQWAYVMVCCPLCIPPSVHPCINFFLKHLLLWNYLLDFDEISQKCSCHGPLQNFIEEFNSVKNSGCHCNKTDFFLKTLKIFLSETISLRATKIGM